MPFVGLFQGDLIFHASDFPRREMTLLSSRNATGEDFPRVIRTLETEELDLASWITHRIRLEKIVDECLGWLMPENYMIKAVIEF